MTYSRCGDPARPFPLAKTSFDLFAWLVPDAAAALSLTMRPRRYNRSARIYLQGDRATEMYRVSAGFVRLSVGAPDGREAVVLLFGPGDFFGISSLIDGEPRPQTADALTPLRVEVLAQGDLERLRADHPNFNDALMRLLARQMRVASMYFVDSHLSSLDARVARRVMELAMIGERPSEHSSHYPLRVWQSELAAMVGASRQSVNKILGRFQGQGLVELRPAGIVVHNVTALARAAGF